VLVLDDYHLVTHPAIHSLMASLVEHLPENLRIAIGARANPPLPLARLRARGQLLEIRTAGLRFRKDEAAQFLNQVMGLDLAPESVLALAGRSEGWIAGLQLAALAIQAQHSSTESEVHSEEDRAGADLPSFNGGHRFLAEYLLEEVVDRLPEEIQWFLLATSLLERMCASLCAVVMNACAGPARAPVDAHHCEAILAQLERGNLFIVALDDQGEWFRYHHLFRDFLLAQLKRAIPQNLPAFHRAASRWLEDHQLLHEAAGHAFQSRDWEFAAAFVERQSFTLITYSEMATMYAWCAAFPEEIMLMHPELCILQSWAWVFTFRRDNRERVEMRLRQAEEVITRLEDRERARGLNEHAAVVRSFLAMAPDPAINPHDHLALGKTMLGRYSGEEAGRFSAELAIGYAHLALSDASAAEQALKTARLTALHSGLFFGLIESSFHLARLAHSQGQLERSAVICHQAREDVTAMLRAEPAAWETTPVLPLPPQEPQLPGLGCLDIALGCVLLEQNRLDEAKTLLERGLKLVGWGMNPFYLVTGLTALFRLREIQDRPLEALACLDHLEEVWPDISFFTRGLRAVHALRVAPGDPRAREEAAAWCAEFAPLVEGPPPGMGPLGAAEVYYTARLAWMRALVATGAADAASASLVIHKHLAKAEASRLTSREIELMLLEAEARVSIGEHETAAALVERALALAQPWGFVRVFDQGPTLAHLLAEAGIRGFSREYIERILTAITRQQDSQPFSAFPADTPSRPGQTLVEPEAWSAKTILVESEVQPAKTALVEPLSQRELEILALVARGASNQTIAEQLVITLGTVKSHMNHILGKLGARSRTEAIARARDLGYL
jgi:LuxR family maltose regulon positive regulatory protein